MNNLILSGNQKLLDTHKTAFLCSRKCPFDESVKRITQETANRRNEIMADLADKIFLAYYTKD